MLTLEERPQSRARETRMTDLHEDKLETLGLDSSSYRALLMLPAVYVAWAGGTLTAGAATPAPC